MNTEEEKRGLESFKVALLCAASEEFPDCDVQLRTITKVGGPVEEIAIKPEGSNIAPAMEVEQFYNSYRHGATMAELMDLIQEELNCLPDVMAKVNVPEFTREGAEKHLTAHLVLRNNSLENEAVTGIFTDDILILPRYEFGFGVATVTKTMAENFNLSDDEILSIACRNVATRGWKLLDMAGMLFGGKTEPLLSDENPDADVPEELMYVLMCREGDEYGSSALLNGDALKTVFKKLGEFYILPSSIHEGATRFAA